LRLHEIPLDNLTAEECALGGTAFGELIGVVEVEEAVALCTAFPGLELEIPAMESEGRPLARPYKETHLRSRLRDLLSGPSYDRFLQRYHDTRAYFPSLKNIRIRRRDKLLQSKADALYVELSAGRGQREGALRNEVATLLAMEFGVSRSYAYRLMKKEA